MKRSRFSEEQIVYAIRQAESGTPIGNRVGVKFTGRGAGKNGRSVFYEGIGVFEINQEGKIQTMWGYWNPAAMMAQLQG
jgi:predicted ester cyclase